MIHSHQQSGFFPLGNQQIHYLRWGTGSRLLLAFHGYGADASQFVSLAPFPEADYTLLSFDIPHHGHSVWIAGHTVSKKELTAFATQICQTFSVSQFALTGYSLGGRFCLCLAECAPQHVSNILLTAPDGLVANPLYILLTRTLIGKLLFRHFIKTPVPYRYLSERLCRKRWLHPARYRMMKQYTVSEADRIFLYHVWNDLRMLVPDYKLLKKHISRSGIPVHLFMGTSDHIIPAKLAEKFKAELNTVQVHLLDKGHILMDTDILPEIIPYLFPA